MVDTDPAWINASGGAPLYSAVELRRLEAVLLYGGVADRLGAHQGVRPGPDPVSLVGTTWTVHDTPAVVYPGETSTSGPYRVALLETAGSVNAAAAQPRKDIIVCQVQDDDEDSSGQRRARPLYVPGVADASPVEPAVPDGSFRIATIDVPASGGGSPTLTVNTSYSVAAGGILPVRNSAALPAAGVGDGMFTYQKDTKALMVHDGASWKVLRYANPKTPQRASNLSTFSGLTSTTYTATATPAGLAFVAPETGRGLLVCQARTFLICSAAADRQVFGTPWLGTGATINGGSAVSIEGTTPPNDDLAFSEARGDNDNVAPTHVPGQGCATYLVDGLTAGSSYNVSLRYRVTNATNTTYLVEDQRLRWIPLY